MSVLVDARGARTGAAVSVLLLGAAFALHTAGEIGFAYSIIGSIGAAMAVSAVTNLKLNLLSAPFQILRRRGAIGAPNSDALQPAAGLRLAQFIGAAFLATALLSASVAGGAISIGLVVTLASLQTLLAVTGICVACKFYGIIVWFDRRRTTVSSNIPRQKIKISK